MDIGSATTHLSLSLLEVGKRDSRMSGRSEVLRRRILHQSAISLTPYRDATSIDAEALERFVRDEIARAGMPLDEVDTGAVICTGEAARKSNAAAISARVSEISGDFVCATAGHDLEAQLGAHGSGAVEASRGRIGPIVLLDVGGGTAKRSVVVGGRIVHTAAINIGTRLLAFDRSSRLVRGEDAGLRIATWVGSQLHLGDPVGAGPRRAVAAEMAELLVQFLGLRPMTDRAEELTLTDPPSTLPPGAAVALSGGLSEYVFGRTEADFGDLGPELADALAARLGELLPADLLLDLGTGIRATVIGAGQFTLQATGDTVFADGGIELPLRGVPVRAVELDWQDLSVEAVDRRVRSRLLAEDDGSIRALTFPGAPHGYGAVRDLAVALRSVLPGLPLAGSVLVFDRDVARTVGERLVGHVEGAPFLCIDEIAVSDLDYLDVGAVRQETDFLAVVVRRLVLADADADGHGPRPTE